MVHRNSTQSNGYARRSSSRSSKASIKENGAAPSTSDDVEEDAAPHENGENGSAAFVLSNVTDDDLDNAWKNEAHDLLREILGETEYERRLEEQFKVDYASIEVITVLKYLELSFPLQYICILKLNANPIIHVINNTFIHLYFD